MKVGHKEVLRMHHQFPKVPQIYDGEFVFDSGQPSIPRDAPHESPGDYRNLENDRTISTTITFRKAKP
jgi:hypothetical protein